MATPSHSNITNDKNIITKDHFAISKQASSRSWDTRPIMANKNDIITQQDDLSWEDVTSDDEQIRSVTKRTRKNFRKRKTSSKKNHMDTQITESEGL